MALSTVGVSTHPIVHAANGSMPALQKWGGISFVSQSPRPSRCMRMRTPYLPRPCGGGDLAGRALAGRLRSLVVLVSPCTLDAYALLLAVL